MTALGRIWVFFGGLGLAAIGATGLYGQQIQVSGANRTLEVTASATSDAKADTATLHIGYQVFGATSDESYRKGSAISSAVATALEHAGAPKDAIESQNQSTEPLQEYQNQNLPTLEAAQRKFLTQQSWTVRTTPNDVAALLAAAVGAGANQSGAVDWSVGDMESLDAAAAAKALQRARAVAEQMAAGLGVKLGPLVYASNQVEDRVRVLPMQARGMVLQQQKAMPKLSLGAPMEHGSATVRAVFAVQ
jgi:uncharacterized protein YggE